MAFIPDDAVMSAHTIPAAAFRLFAYYCMRRDQKTGLCYPSLRRTASDLQLNYTYVSEMRALLIKSGWIKAEDCNEIRPLKGFSQPESSSAQTETSSARAETISSAETEEKFGANRRVVRLEPKKVSAETELHIKDEPAHITSPFNQPIEPKEIDIGVRVEKVFQDYCETVKKVVRTEKRLSLIKVRLLEGHSENELHAVWLGALRDPWPERKLQNDITVLLGTPERIERMVELSTIDLTERNGNGKDARNYQAGGVKPPVKRDFSKYSPDSRG